ncbi:alpha-hydroxyketone-type quorum-sensing autoinducer synthase [Pseudomonas khavaziana]|uniref:alpha-hydroxyketone-type quorum-sensing autoinducer synthase n=1 Tax=Pseudomonas khavaziana TaxID=2842351 RepID=UPI001C3CA3F4|nr:alpha-hydroxyketone-type quorum-sensing autoinducer synthase [Pseudomonas khavaziana]MBV4483824.1 quorum-sensing autoinducer CAI-1 synthase [Pseudomonas khavaziana]
MYASMPTFLEDRIATFSVEKVQKAWGGRNIFHGATPAADALHLSSNDYLNLLNEPVLIEARAKEFLHAERELLMSAVFLRGESPISRLEDKLARFTKFEGAIICQSGWTANVGLIQAIANSKVPVYLDLNAHMSLWQGAVSAGAKAIAFMHNNVSHAERQIRKHGVGILVVDSVYSTNGSLCPLTDFANLSKDTGCVFVVDESHSLGTHGPHGAGLVAELGLTSKVHFLTASLAKAFAGRAGFIACPSIFKDYFAMESYPAIFSSAVLNHEVAWFDKLTDFVVQADLRRERLHSVTRTIRNALSELGYDLSSGTEQIIALESGTECQTMILRDALESYGVFGSMFLAPATPKNRTLVRFSVNSGITDNDVDRLISVCSKIRHEIKLDSWPRRKARGVVKPPTSSSSAVPRDC